MKKIFTILSIVVICFSSCTYDDAELVGRVEDLENRVTLLEKLCKEMNSNISAIQTIVEALQNNDYVTGVTPIEENGVIVGYTISFTKSDSITIYHGKDGNDGVDGRDGYTPVIGVKQDNDGIYYWTLDGEWLTDASGNKIKAVGIDGANGENGEDGINGSNGEDGTDGITPQLKIENDYWYVSYDNGNTWTILGKATGEDGANGSNGADGVDGDAFFYSVDTSNEDYVIFTLADGTTIQIPTWYAFNELKEQCEEMNKNISAVQQILDALQNNDYVTSVQHIVENGETIGYTIYFSKSGAVTIYHGENGIDGVDGEDGADGANGKDGHSPVVGVRQDSDGIYYWTLDGEWLLDDNGNKIKAIGADGKDGVDGDDGTNGEDGVDGITPQLKIEDEYWYISYDNGSTWNKLGKATGEDGKDGQNGTNGDAFFKSVDTANNNYVVLILIDGTEIKIPTWYAFEELQVLCNQMNTNISSLQTIVAALQNNDYITSITPIMDNGETIGYTINFSKSGAITIYHGKNGDNGTDGHSPQIGVKQDTDGVYYWALDGEWLLDDAGSKVKAVGIDGINGTNGIDGITPQLKIENDFWYISYDNGTSWTQLDKASGEDGEDGDSFFKTVTQDEQNVYFILTDGTTITIPKGAQLDITFDINDLFIVSPNTTREINYTVTSATNVVVEVTSSADIKAKVVTDDTSGKRGKIIVNIGSSVDEYSKVIVFVSNGEKVVMKSIAFEQSGLEITDGASQSISPFGGAVTLRFLANIDWRVEIPSAAQSWISPAANTLAMTEHSTKLNISPNTTSTPRSSVVKIVSMDDALSIDFTISQDYITSFTTSSIVYTTDDGNVVDLYTTEGFGSEYVSNVYDKENNIGTITFAGDINTIPAEAFLVCSNLTSIQIPNTVTTIAEKAFYGCNYMEKIIIPESVTNIAETAFEGCSGEAYISCNVNDKAFVGALFTKVIMDDNVTSIGKESFMDCVELKSVTLSKNLRTIPYCAFQNTAIENITIPEGVVALEDGAFYQCSKLKTVILPESLNIIGGYGFASCSMLQKVKMPVRMDGIGKEAFMDCVSLLEFVIPEGVTSIEQKTFHNCSSLTSLTLPSSITAISGAFYGCYKLTRLNIPNVEMWLNIVPKGAVGFLGGEVPFADSGQGDIYVGGELLTDLVIPNNILTIYGSTFRNCTSIKSLTIGSRVTKIGDAAFDGCRNLSNIVFSKSTTTYGIRAFAGTGITEITITKQIANNNSGNEIFADCKELTQVTIEDGVTIIPYGMFSAFSSIDSNKLTSITIPDSVTSIGSFAFSGCIVLQNIYWHDSIRSLGNGVFKGCESLTEITIPKETAEINNSVFEGCTSLKQVNMHNDITSIGRHAFMDCHALENLTLPKNLTTIGSEAFWYCHSLKHIDIPEGVKTIGYQVFLDSGLEEVVLPESLESIGYRAFACPIKSIIIPTSVTNIEAAFMFAYKLETAYFCSTKPPYMDSRIFDYAGNHTEAGHTTIYVPNEAVDAYKAALPQYVDQIVGYNPSEQTNH